MKIISTLNQIKDIPLAERQLWYIPESISTTIPIQECGEKLVDVMQEAAHANISLVNAAGQNKPLYLREGAIKRLLQAASLLDAGLAIKISETFRPLKVQRQLFNEIKVEIANKEKLAGQELWERVTQFIADPDLCAPHTTGGAIDCTLVNLIDSTELDMGVPMNTATNEARTWEPGITPTTHKNRALLFDAMTQAGFVNLPTEWWHYSYGDQYWAAQNEEKYAIYNSLDLPSP